MDTSEKSQGNHGQLQTGLLLIDFTSVNSHNFEATKSLKILGMAKELQLNHKLHVITNTTKMPRDGIRKVCGDLKC